LKRREPSTVSSQPAAAQERHLRTDLFDRARPGHAIQVPLAVPEISTSGAARSIQIRVTPPAGSLLSGDAFPVFQQNATELANFPSHIEIEIGTRRAGRFRFS